MLIGWGFGFRVSKGKRAESEALEAIWGVYENTGPLISSPKMVGIPFSEGPQLNPKP